MKKEFTVSIKDDMREIERKPYFLSGEDIREPIDIYNEFVEKVGDSEPTAYELNRMANAIIKNNKRNKVCRENEEAIVKMITDIANNIEVGESFTRKSLGRLNYLYSLPHLFNTALKRLINDGYITEKRMAIKRSSNVYIKVYTRIK